MMQATEEEIEEVKGRVEDLRAMVEKLEAERKHFRAEQWRLLLVSYENKLRRLQTPGLTPARRCENCSAVLPDDWRSNSQYDICPLCEDEIGD